MFSITAAELIGSARVPLAELARLADATAAEVKEAEKLLAKARVAEIAIVVIGHDQGVNPARWT